MLFSHVARKYPGEQKTKVGLVASGSLVFHPSQTSRTDCIGLQQDSGRRTQISFVHNTHLDASMAVHVQSDALLRASEPQQ